VPVIQTASPAGLVVSTLYRTFSSSITDYTYVDFCAGAGGPTPFIEKELNAQLSSGHAQSTENYSQKGNGLVPRSPRPAIPQPAAVKFVLTDLHPHIPDWTEAAKKSENLSFISEPVDAANAPSHLNSQNGKKIFRLYNLAFHHFDDELGSSILRNTLETADGFGYALSNFITLPMLTLHSIFELQERTISSLITICLMGLLMFFITPFYFWRSPTHLFFTYIIPVIPFVLVFDGYISSLRTRSPGEIQALMNQCGASCEGWTIKSGNEMHTFPTGYMTWIIAVKN